MTDGTLEAQVENMLLELATQEATGALTVSNPDGEQSIVWFRDGRVYSVSVPGRRPLLGVRLMSSGALTPESLAEALEVQRTELQGWRLGELLVHLGFVDRAVVEAFVLEQVRDQVADLLHWRVIKHRFRNGQRTRQDVAPPSEVTTLLAEAHARDAEWAAITGRVGGPDSVPVLSASDSAAGDVVLGPYDWALLCKVDGVRSIADLADDCGFTVFEAGRVVDGLAAAGLVEVDAAEPSEDDDGAAPEPEPEFDVAGSVARVTAALSDMFGPSHAESELAPVVSLDEERRDREAQAGAWERERADAERVEAERIEAERLEAEHVAAEQEAARLEAERLEAERAEAERVAAEEEAARLEAERLAAERVEAEDAARAEAELREAQAAAEAAAPVEDDDSARLEAALSEPIPAIAPLDRPGYAAMLTELVLDTADPELAEPAAAAPAEPDQVEPEPLTADDAELAVTAEHDEPSEAPDDRDATPALVGAPDLSEQTDTAALLRELSSLGGFTNDSASAPAATARPVPRKPPPEPEKKRKGLFRR